LKYLLCKTLTYSFVEMILFYDFYFYHESFTIQYVLILALHSHSYQIIKKVKNMFKFREEVTNTYNIPYHIPPEYLGAYTNHLK